MRRETSGFKPIDDLPGNLFCRSVFNNARFPALRGQVDRGELHPADADLGSLGLLQCRHHGAHIHHAHLGIVGRFRQAAGGPAEQGRRPVALADLVAPALDPLEDPHAPGVERDRTYGTGSRFELDVPTSTATLEGDASLCNEDAPVSLSFSYTPDGWRWQMGDVSLELPFPGMAGDYQVQNAAAVVTLLHLVAERLPVRPEALADMARKARALARPDAVHEVVDLCLAYADGRAAA